MTRNKRNKQPKEIVPAAPKQPTAKEPEPPKTEDSGSHSSTRMYMEERVMQSIHMGPLPDPETLARYDQICPGVAKQLVESVQREQDRRFENQKEFWIDTKRRRWLSFSLGAVICVLAGWAIYNDHPMAASAIVALVGILAYVNKDPIRQSRTSAKSPVHDDKDDD